MPTLIFQTYFRVLSQKRSRLLFWLIRVWALSLVLLQSVLLLRTRFIISIVSAVEREVIWLVQVIKLIYDEIGLKAQIKWSICG